MTTLRSIVSPDGGITVAGVRAAIEAHLSGTPEALAEIMCSASWGLHDHGRVRVRRAREDGHVATRTHVLIDGIEVAYMCGGWWHRGAYVRVLSEIERLEYLQERRATREANRLAAAKYAQTREAVIAAIQRQHAVEWWDGQKGGTLRLGYGYSWVSAEGASRAAGVAAPGERLCGQGLIIRWTGSEWRLVEDTMDPDPPRVFLSGRIDRGLLQEVGR